MSKKILYVFITLLLLQQIISESIVIFASAQNNDGYYSSEIELTNNENFKQQKSIGSPTKARVIVDTGIFASPSPDVGEYYGYLPKDTNVWVVEKVWHAGSSRWYYYSGFTFNGQSWRGYICEDNVYIGDNRLLPQNVADETRLSSKMYTSLSSNVYSGPDDNHAVIGSVGVESVAVIRREKMKYFIEYTVNGSGKKKRGFIHIDYIQKPTTGYQSYISTGKYYIKNKATGKYLTVRDGAVSQYTYVDQNTFNARRMQEWYVNYDSSSGSYTFSPSLDPTMYMDILYGYTEGDGYNAVLWNSSGRFLNRSYYLKKTSDNYTYKLLTACSSGVECLDLSYRNSNDNTYTVMRYDDNSIYQEWVFEKTDTAFLTNEKNETLSMAIEDLYVPISVATNTRLDLKGWVYNDAYRLSGIQCYAGGNNYYVDIDLKIYSNNLKINGADTIRYNLADDFHITGTNSIWSDNYYQKTLSVNKSSNNTVSVDIYLQCDRGLISPITSANVVFNSNDLM